MPRGWVLIGLVLLVASPVGVGPGVPGHHVPPPRNTATVLGAAVTSTGPGPAEPVHPAAGPHTFPTKIQHVIEIYLENQGLSNVLAKGPYEKQLYGNYSSASELYSVCHPSAPNYIAVTSGTTLQCGSDGLTVYGAQNIANETSSAGLQWDGYLESMPAACDTTNTSLYQAHHNPFLYYSDLRASCPTRDLALANLTNDFPFNTTPANYTWISPNMDNDGHNTGVRVADTWLSQFLPKVMAAPWFDSSAVFVQYDESCDGGTGCAGTTDTSSYPALENASGCRTSSGGCGGHVYLTVVSPFTRGQGLYTANASAWNVLCTEEWLLGLPATGNEDCGAEFPAMTSMFNASAFVPSTYPVVYSETGLPTGTNWSVTLNGTRASSRTTSLVFAEPNGTYAWSAGSIPGFTASPAGGNVSVTGNATNLTVDFVPRMNETFPVTFNETGLTPGTRWSMDLEGTVVSATTGSIGFLEPNGTHPYSVGQVPGWTTPSFQGSLRVAGAPVARAIPWSVTTYAVTFTETGLPAGIPWWVNVSREVPATSTAPSLTILEPNGTYSFNVSSSDPRYHGVSGGFAVDAAARTVVAAFLNFSYSLTFAESGLPTGTAWTVVFEDMSVMEPAPTNVTFRSVPTGTFRFTASSVGYVATPASGNVTVHGVPTPITILFRPAAGVRGGSAAPPSFFGLPAAEGYVALGLLVIVALVAAVFLVVTSRRRRRPPAQNPPSPARP